MVSLIAAQSKNKVIGKNGTLPWKLKTDMDHFKAMTSTHPVIMGRKTFESLPPKHRPLPNRTNIVLTRSLEYKPDGVMVAHSIQEAITQAQQAPGGDQVFVIGGAEIYQAALPEADQVYLTEVEAILEGDAFFPVLAEDEWKQELIGEFPISVQDEYAGKFLLFTRR